MKKYRRNLARKTWKAIPRAISKEVSERNSDRIYRKTIVEELCKYQYLFYVACPFKIAKILKRQKNGIAHDNIFNRNIVFKQHFSKVTYNIFFFNSELFFNIPIVFLFVLFVFFVPYLFYLHLVPDERSHT